MSVNKGYSNIYNAGFFYSLFVVFLRKAFTLFYLLIFLDKFFSLYLLFDQNFSLSTMDKHKNWGF